MLHIRRDSQHSRQARLQRDRLLLQQVRQLRQLTLHVSQHSRQARSQRARHSVQLSMQIM